MKLAILLGVVLTGCSIGWSKPGATRSDFARDGYTCQGESAQMYPVMIQSSNTYVGSGNTHCSTTLGNTNCTTDAVVSPIGGGQDMNLTSRNIAFGSCMRSRGWQWKMSGSDSEASSDKNKSVRDGCLAACTDESCRQYCWAYYPKT
jgi:hypothetical protein